MEAVDRPDRDSHDLSYLATRFSVVDSMLSSLSDLPTSTLALIDYASNYPTGIEDEASSTKRPTASNTGRRRGHTQSSSLDNYDLDIDDIAARYSDYHTSSRGRTNGVANPTRRSSRTQSRRRNANMTRPSLDRQSKTKMARHSRGTAGKGSEGSGSSSVDLGYTHVPLNGRIGRGVSRAASFDHNFGDRVARSSPKPMLSSQTLDASEAQPDFDYANSDAAPTPTIPAGPRRPQEPLSPHLASPPPTTPMKSVPSRKNSIRSTMSKMTRKTNGNTMDAALRDQAKQFVQATNNMRNGYATTGPAPSPTVGGPRRQHPILMQNPPKERPGFFRRLFGSDRNNDDNRRPPSPPPLPNIPITNIKRPQTQGNPQHIASQLKSNSRPSTQDAAQTSREERNLTLKKSHSSFFRRRKKSISENPPPVPPLQMPQPHSQPSLPKLMVNVAQISPNGISPGVSSLRKVMDPYLTDMVSPDEPYFDSHEHQPEETIRVVENGRLPTAPGRTAVPAHLLEANGQPRSNDNSEPYKPAMKIRRGRIDLIGDNEGSFPNDSSGNESPCGDSPDNPNLPRFGFPRPASNSATFSSTPASFPIENNPPPSRPAPIPHQKRNDLRVLSTISDRSYLSRSPEPIRRSPLPDDIDEDGLEVPNGSLSRTGSREWLDQPSSSEEKLANSTGYLKLPLDAPRTSEKTSPVSDVPSPTSENDVFASATSLPLVQVDSGDGSENWIEAEVAQAILVNDTDITPADRERARKIFEGEEDFVSKAEAAAWLGRNTANASRTRRTYMELYDWCGYNILTAFRELCGRLVVKAESQQLDRVIDAFSERWCACNPSHGFKDRDVVHTITFSVLMLNTDLHVADLDQRMTRSQFVKNTLPTIRSIAEAAAAESHRKQSGHSRANLGFEHPSSPNSPSFPPESRPSDDRTERPSLEVKRSRNRLSSRPPVRQDSDGPEGSSGDNFNVLVNAPYTGNMKGWEFQVEIVLKEFYGSIRTQRLPLHGATTTTTTTTTQTQEQSSNSLAVVANALRRTPSVLSKAPSDTVSYRGRGTAFKSATERLASRKPSRPRIYPTSTVGSSRNSLDDQSVFSPAGSTWSKYSFGKTQTSLSVDSFGSHFAHGDYQQAIGFANALSQAIIREEAGSSAAGNSNGSEQDFGRSMPLLEDESLELVGPPWAKEGIVKHRHHLESLEKKAKDRGWNECFAVIEKGWIRLFSFSPTKSSGKSILARQRAKSRAAAAAGGGGGGAVVGGGNWTENAEALGCFLLRQTIASALPPPGFSKSRPHVFALSLPTGAVHLFSVGTAEIVKEFVSTANYWSARLSKEPLIGGVSNVEYGWSDAIIGTVAPQVSSRPGTASTSPPPPGSASGMTSGGVILSMPRSNVASPLQSPTHVAHCSVSSVGCASLDQVTTGRELRSRPPGDKAQISDWTPPVQSMMASNLMEVDQLRALTNYVFNVEEELKRHNELRGLMGCSVSRHLSPSETCLFADSLRRSTPPATPTLSKRWRTGKRNPPTYFAKSSSSARTLTVWQTRSWSRKRSTKRGRREKAQKMA